MLRSRLLPIGLNPAGRSGLSVRVTWNATDRQGRGWVHEWEAQIRNKRFIFELHKIECPSHARAPSTHGSAPQMVLSPGYLLHAVGR